MMILPTLKEKVESLMMSICGRIERVRKRIEKDRGGGQNSKGLYAFCCAQLYCTAVFHLQGRFLFFCLNGIKISSHQSSQLIQKYIVYVICCKIFIKVKIKLRVQLLEQENCINSLLKNITILENGLDLQYYLLVM